MVPENKRKAWYVHKYFWAKLYLSRASLDFVLWDARLNSESWVDNGYVGMFGDLGLAHRTTQHFSLCPHISLCYIINEL